jgi:excisionase family DNA binding protein
MKTAKGSLPRLLSIPHIAEHLGVCTKTVRRLIQSGELISLRVGSAIRVTETDLVAYLSRARSRVH